MKTNTYSKGKYKRLNGYHQLSLSHVLFTLILYDKYLILCLPSYVLRGGSLIEGQLLSPFKFLNFVIVMFHYRTSL